MAGSIRPPEEGYDLIVTAPGRINLIGEHTDYNMGYVLPAAIDKKITFKFRRKPGGKALSFYSKTTGKTLNVSLDALVKSPVSWENYLLGVVYEISRRTSKLEGFDCMIESTLPTGSGLSSSAALECGLAMGLNELYDLQLNPWELITLSRDAEHHFVGTRCGIMDQFASIMGREGHAMLLDCRSLEFSHHRIRLGPYQLLLANSHVSHSLAESEYNLRRAQCEEALEIMGNNNPGLSSLRDVSPELLTASRGKLGPVLYSRCAYILAENERVLRAVRAMEQDDLQLLGNLLYASHDGLRHHYQVSCPELDFLVDHTKSIPEVLGARMMGGGFGGCTLNLIHQKAVDSFCSGLASTYRKQFGLQLSFFEGVPSAGASVAFRKD